MERYMAYSENLCYEYERSEGGDSGAMYAQALRGIDLRIERGDFVAVLGRNGSGKSTLARNLNALLSPTSGTLFIKGIDARKPENVWDVRQATGMVFQNPDSQLIATVVEEDVAFGPENLGIPPAEIRKRVESSLKSVKMSGYATHAPQYLSGGQKQRVVIAGILAMEPECIVLDEPTAMLDPSGRREVLETVTRLNKEANVTVILITHYMEEAVLAKRVVVMDGGSVAMEGTPREIFRRVEELRKIGLDVPQTAAISHALRQNGVDMEIALTVDEFVESYIKSLGSRCA